MDNQNQPNQPAQMPPSSPQNVPPTPPSYQAPQPQPTPSAFQEPPKKKRTGLIIGIILGSIAVIAIIAAILIYFLWWQNPQKARLNFGGGNPQNERCLLSFHNTDAIKELNLIGY